MSEPGQPQVEPAENSRHGRLSTQLSGVLTASTNTGMRPLESPNGELLALAYVPAPVTDGPYRLVVLLHGAGGSPRQGIDLLLPVAEQHRLLLLAPKSSRATWDLIAGGFGPDVRRIDANLEEVLQAYPVERVIFGGFSDGASYALALGLTNGDLCEAILAFSPGFAAPLGLHGQPRVFISHGTGDRVLPITACSRRIVPRLRALEYPVEYQEFDGGHEIPEPVRKRAVDWLVSDWD
jgi:predicted esterase